MIVKMNPEGDEIQLPTAGKLQEMAGIKANASQELVDEAYLPRFLREDIPRRPLAERVTEESEVFVRCVKYLRGELEMPRDQAYDYALRILMIERY